ncbi:succinylglutamate-semialdehyde dehydrogenase [Alphaproteobacteria bacterium 46_93_T64]|nr:succinylglutamate-semialdehyde dehydrogenase [Alphaproteobacteria bacterium 46_93_T64]
MLSGKLFINGNWQDGHGNTILSTSPTSDAVLLSGKSATEQDVSDAVSAARTAFKNWALLPFEDRVSTIRRYQEVLRAEQNVLAELISLECGKPHWEAKLEVATMIGKIDVSLKSHEARTGTTEAEVPGAVARLRHKPHGVIAVFGPFNFPGHLPNGHIVPALLAGNTIVFKPSEQTAGVGEFMTSCWEEAELPAGVLNLVQGNSETGIELSTHDGINGLFFTGSSHTGALLHSEFAGHPAKILALEMGGNNPLIVTDISDIRGAVYHTIQSAFITAGQRCTCARRLIVPIGEEGDHFISALVSATKNIKVGPQMDNSDPFMGSVISNTAADDLLTAQENLSSLGGKILKSMARTVIGKPYLSPGIIDVTSIGKLPDEEYFGPLLQIIRVSDFDTAIDAANNTRYGLSAGLISDDPALYEKFLALSSAGIVNWNRPLTGASGSAPFGGIGASGNHRPSAYYAADYCAYPVASLEAEKADLPAILTPGISV